MKPWQPPEPFVEDEVRRDDMRYSFSTFHPQWGGYHGKCTVTFDVPMRKGGGFDSHDPACFDVVNWHDGEFPSDTCSTAFHYCDPTQLVRFGIEILEHQHAALEATDGSFHGFDYLDSLIEQLQALKDNR